MVQRPAIPKPKRRGRATKNLIRAQARGAQVADPGVAVRLRQLGSVLAPDQGVVKEARRNLAPEEPGQLNLPTGRGEQVLSADHEVNALVEVVHHHRELVGPLAEAIARQNVAALFGGGLIERTEPEILERHGPGLEADATRPLDLSVHGSIPAGSRVAPFSGRGAPA